MAKSSKDLADALGAMMSGDVPLEQAHADGQDATTGPAAPAPPPPRPAARPAAAFPPAATPKPNASTATPRPAASPVRRPAPTPNPVPAPPIPRAPAPPAPQRAAASRPSRPAAPQPAAAPANPKPPAAAAPRPTAAAPTASSSPPPAEPIEYAKPASKRAKALPFYATIDFRETAVPPLLVGGAGLIVLAVLYFLQDADAALRQMGPVVPIVVALIGGVLIGLGALNMTQLKKQLAERAANAKPSKSKPAASSKSKSKTKAGKGKAR